VLRCFFPVKPGADYRITLFTYLGILNNALIGCWSESGGSLSANSIAVIPKDQISQRQS
jgi:hypothetical protein